MPGAISATSAITAHPVRARGVRGSLLARSGHQADLSALYALRGAGDAAGGAVGSLARGRRVGGDVGAASGLVGYLLTFLPLRGTVAATGGLVGALMRSRGLAGGAPGMADLAARLRRVRRVPGEIMAGSALADPVLVRFWWPQVEVMFRPNENMRRLTWNTDEEIQIWLDGQYHAHAGGGEFVMPKDTVIRQLLDIWDEPPHTIRTPLDRVSLSWTGDAAEYQVWRSKDGGPWELIATVKETSYVDGPLRDGTYDYKVIAVDEEGDTAESGVQSVIVSSAPEPPRNLRLVEA